MTTKEILEKEFDEQDFSETSGLYEDRETYIDLDNVKKHIFEKMIPKVFEEMLLPDARHENEVILNKNLINTYIKQKAKEQFNIDL